MRARISRSSSRRRHVVEALVERLEGAREVDVGVLGDVRLPRGRVEAGLARARHGADVRAALEHRLLAAEAGAHDAALAAEDVQQPRLGLAVLEVGDGVDEVLAPVGAHDVAAQQVLVEVGGLQHPARDGEEGAEAAVRRVEVLAGLVPPEEADAARGEEGAELHVGERRVDLALELLVAGLALLGDAGPDEHDLEVRAVLLVQHARDREHRRDDGREAVEDVGVVLAHVADHRRAGGGDVAPVVLSQQPHVLLGDEVGAEADLVDAGEAEVPERADQAGRAALRELGRVARRHDRRDGSVAGEQFLGLSRCR